MTPAAPQDLLATAGKDTPNSGEETEVQRRLGLGPKPHSVLAVAVRPSDISLPLAATPPLSKVSLRQAGGRRGRPPALGALRVPEPPVAGCLDFSFSPRLPPEGPSVGGWVRVSAQAHLG